jgi:hypothetical protein
MKNHLGSTHPKKEKSNEPTVKDFRCWQTHFSNCALPGETVMQRPIVTMMSMKIPRAWNTVMWIYVGREHGLSAGPSIAQNGPVVVCHEDYPAIVMELLLYKISTLFSSHFQGTPYKYRDLMSNMMRIVE